MEKYKIVQVRKYHYLIDTEATINVYDWFLGNTFVEKQVVKKVDKIQNELLCYKTFDCGTESCFKEYADKIIATTNPNLKLPLLDWNAVTTFQLYPDAKIIDIEIVEEWEDNEDLGYWEEWADVKFEDLNFKIKPEHNVDYNLLKKK